MGVFSSQIRKYTTLLVSLTVLITSNLVAEGTREVAPNGNIILDNTQTTDIAALHIDNPTFNSFASYDNSNVNSRLHIHITDPSSECIYLGFSAGHANQTSMNPPQTDFEYRILDPNGNIVFGPVTVFQNNPNISNWQEAFNGPEQVVGVGGYDATVVSSTDLTSQGFDQAGDYYIEFRSLDIGAFLIDFWDITVADCSVVDPIEKRGRVWSYNWAFFAINDFGFPDRPFNGAFYVCAPDPLNPSTAFVTLIDFNNSGFRPAAFNIAFNSFGTQNTGNIMVDRRSVQNSNATTPEYAIFLNDPIDICQTAEAGDIDLLGIARCDAENYCLKFTTNRAGQVDLLLDFDGQDGIYTPGTSDVMIVSTVSTDDVDTELCIDWDGLDGFGNPINESNSTIIPISLSFAQGIYHFPIYDAELMTTGFDISSVRPAGQKPLLYYDDTNIDADSGSGEPELQLTGCLLPCHRWTNYTNAQAVGFGNLNTINSWWFSQQSMTTEVFFLPAFVSCDINAPQVICEGDSTILTLITEINPEDGSPIDLGDVTWTGPGIIEDNDSLIIINTGGDYMASFEWINNLNDTCTTSCLVTVNEELLINTVIDTLINFGDSIVINSEIYSENGTFIQTFTSVNGCDSLLTINVEVEIPEIELICQILGDTTFCVGDTFQLDLLLEQNPPNFEMPEILSLNWFGPSIINEDSLNIIANESGFYEAEVLYVNLSEDTLVATCGIFVDELQVFETIVDTLINFGDTININGEDYSEMGSFSQFLTAVNGCDSLLIINVEIIEPLYTCVINGPDLVCLGDNALLTSIPILDPQDANSPDIISVQWTGPDFNSTNDPYVIDPQVTGHYSSEIQWIGINGDTLSNSCSHNIIINPSYQFSIDTLIIEGDTIRINDVLFGSEGNFVQNFTTVDGCDSIYFINIIEANGAVYYDLNDCKSSDYSLFTPQYNTSLECGLIEGSVLFRNNPEINAHSCTPGINGESAVCISSLDDCDYFAGDEKSAIIELVVYPEIGEAIQITSLSFFERAPEMFQWNVGTTGINNYPTLYGIRVLKNNQEIYRSVDNPTSEAWTREVYVFGENDDFRIQEPTLLRFEFLSYCLAGVDSDVTAWDLDEIQFSASCTDFVSNRRDISGFIRNLEGEGISNVDLELETASGDLYQSTDDEGFYAFNDQLLEGDYNLKASHNVDPLNGVSTADLILIQRHILGLEKLSSPYKMIAADIDKSASITAVDILYLRKLILGIIDEFPHKDSYRFIPTHMEPSINNPYLHDASLFINDLDVQQSSFSFYGLKTGDVNNDSQLMSSNNGKRSSQKLIVDDKSYLAGEIIRVPFELESPAQAYQLELDLKAFELQDIISSQLSAENIHYDGESLVISYDKPTGDNQLIFTLLLRVNSNGRLSNDLNFITDRIIPEVYQGSDFSSERLILDFGNNSNTNQSVNIFPQPFDDVVNIEIESNVSSALSIEIYSVDGRLVLSQDEIISKGKNTYSFYNSELGQSSVFIYHITLINQTFTGKIIRS